MKKSGKRGTEVTDRFCAKIYSEVNSSIFLLTSGLGHSLNLDWSLDSGIGTLD